MITLKYTLMPALYVKNVWISSNILKMFNKITLVVTNSCFEIQIFQFTNQY